MLAYVICSLAQLGLSPFEVSLSSFNFFEACDIDFRAGSRDGVVKGIRVEGMRGSKGVFGELT